MKKIFTILFAAVLCLGTVIAQVELAGSGGAQSVAYSPNGGGEAYMSIGNYIYKSTDGGDTWGTTPFYTHPTGGIITKIDFLPGSAYYIYFSVMNVGNPDNGGLFKMDVADTDDLTTMHTGTVVSNFDIIPGTANFLISDIVNGQNYLHDGMLTPVLTGVKVKSMLYRYGGGWTPDYFYGATDDGMWYEAFQYGQSYGIAKDMDMADVPYTNLKGYMADDGWGGTYLKSFHAAKDAGANPGKLYVYDEMLYWPPQAELTSITWTGTSTDDYPRVIDIHENGDTIYVGEYNEAAVSMDGGSTWTNLVFSGAENTVLDITYSPDDAGIVLLACANGMLISNDTLKTYVAASSLPTPTTFENLGFYVESGSTDDLNVNIADGDGISTVTVDGTVGDNFDISTAGVLSVKSGVTLSTATLTGTITVTDDKSEVTTADVTVVVMDAEDATYTNNLFLVREKTIEDFPLVTGIADANMIVGVAFDPAGDLDEFFLIDKEGIITFDESKSIEWDFTHNITGDTLKGDVIVTDILGDETIISVTVVVDALPVFGLADWSGKVTMETYTDVNDTFMLEISDANGLAMVELGGMLGELYNTDSVGTLTLKDGVTLEPGKVNGFVKVTDSLDRVYFYADNISLIVHAPKVYEQISMSNTVFYTRFYWMSWMSEGKYNDVYGLKPNVPDMIKSARLLTDDNHLDTVNINNYYAAAVNWSGTDINLTSTMQFDTTGTGIVLADTLWGVLEIVDQADDTTSWNITMLIHNNVGSLSNLNTVVFADDTAGTVNLYPYDSDGIDTLELAGDVTNFFTVDAAGMLTQIQGTNLGENDQLNITGSVTLFDALGEEITKNIEFVVDHPYNVPDTVVAYVVADKAGKYTFEYPVSDKNGFASVKYYAYGEKNADNYSFFYLKDDTSFIIEYYEEYALTDGDSIFATYQFADNAGYGVKNMVFTVHTVEEMLLTDLEESADENTTPEYQLVITPAEAISELALTGEVAEYFEVSETGFMTMKAGAELDFETDSEITGTYTVVDTRTGLTYEANIIITLNDLASVGSTTLNGMKIYPNPATDILNINNVAGSEIKVYNTLGALVDSFFAESEAVVYNVSHLNEGLYIISVIRENTNRSIRVSVVK